MTFDSCDLRQGKDVFDAAGTYLGTVVWVVSSPGDRPPLSRDRERSVGVADVPAAQRPGVEGHPKAFSGESIGPMPTADLGNTGPSSQSPTSGYATSPKRSDTTQARRPTTLFVVRLLTSLNWSSLRPRVWRIPVRLVQAVSHERIVLSVAESEIA